MGDLNVDEVFNKLEDREYRLSSGEAAAVWLEVYRFFQTYPDRQGGMLKVLYNRIEREAMEGKRCGVCGDYENPDCREDC